MTETRKNAIRKLPLRVVYARLLRIARPSRAVLSSILMLTLLAALIAVALPWPLKLLVDNVFGGAPLPPLVARAFDLLGVETGTQRVIVLPLLAFLLNLTSGLVNVAKTQLEVAAGQGSVFLLRARLLDHYQRLSLQEHRAMAMGDQLYRVSHDTYCVDQLLLAGLLPLLGSGLTLFGMLFVLWAFNPWLALLSLAVVPLLFVCVRYYMGPLEDESMRVNEDEAAVLGFAAQVLGSLSLVKAFVRETQESRSFSEKGRKALDARLRLTAKEAWFAFSAAAVTAGGTSLILAVGGLNVLRGHLTVGELLVVIAYLASVYEPLHVISFTIGQVQTAMAGARRVLEVLETDTESRGESAGGKKLPAVKGEIRFEGVTFGYDAGRTVIDDMSFTVPAGSLTAIVGPTGAGKTTITSLLLRFCQPQRGRVLVDGHDIREVSVASLRRQISIVPQEATLFPASVAENLRYGRVAASAGEIEAAARAAHADTFIRALPEGYDTTVAEGGVTLSGGERQRLALARAFVKNAPILVLDEPTSSLDAASESLILESIERLTKERTTIVIAHRLSTIRRADQILFVQDGRIIERGTHAELLELGGAYARLHHLYLSTAGAETKT